METLTRQELDILMEALDAWQEKDALTNFMEAMIKESPFGAGVSFEAKKRQREIEHKNRKDRSILIQAKLIGIRDRKTAGEFVDQSIQTTEV